MLFTAVSSTTEQIGIHTYECQRNDAYPTSSRLKLIFSLDPFCTILIKTVFKATLALQKYGIRHPFYDAPGSETVT